MYVRLCQTTCQTICQATCQSACQDGWTQFRLYFWISVRINVRLRSYVRRNVKTHQCLPAFVSECWYFGGDRTKWRNLERQEPHDQATWGTSLLLQWPCGKALGSRNTLAEDPEKWKPTVNRPGWKHLRANVYLKNYQIMCVSMILFPSYIAWIYIYNRRKFRSQTSDNMDRWKAEMGRVREEKRRRKRKSQKKEDPGAQKGRKVAKLCVFPKICRSGGSKSRLAKAAGAEPAGQMRDKKLHAVVARSTFSKSKCTKHTMLGPLLEVEMSKKCTLLWREAHFEVKSAKNWGVRSTFGSSDVVLRGRRKGLCTLSKVSKTWLKREGL